MEPIEKFLPDNNELSVYYRIKKEFPLLDENLLNVLSFDELCNEEYYQKIRNEEMLKNKILLEQIENNKNTITNDGFIAHIPVEELINNIDYTVDDNINELINSFSNTSIDVPKTA